MQALRTGPATGLAAQLALVAGLAWTVHIGAAAAAAGVGYGLVLAVLLSGGLAQAGSTRLGPADRVTLIRATLAGGVTALVVDSFTGGQVPVGVLVGIAALALALDAVDGKVARRTGTVSPLGARFDMEVDAFLLLVLSAYATHACGGWVLSIGLMRYVFVAAAWVQPWMRGTLPQRYWRKVVAASQGVALVIAAAAVLPEPLLDAVLAVSLALLVESFGRDVGWLWAHRPAGRVPALSRAVGAGA